MELAILLVAVLAHLAIGAFTFSHNPRSATLRAFLLFTIFSAAWSTANYFSLHVATPEATLNTIRWVMFFASAYTLCLFLTIHTFPQARLKLAPWKLTLLLGVNLAVMLLTRTPLIFSAIVGTGANASPLPGPAIPLFAIVTGFSIVGSLYLLFSRLHRATGIYRAQLQYLAAGVMGTFLLIFLTNFVLVILFKINSLLILGPTYTLIFISATAYAIVAHQLFDIRIIIKRTVVYSGLLLFTLGVYSMVIFFFSTIFGGNQVFEFKTFLANLVAAAFIAIGFEPIRRYLTKVTDKYLFKGEYDPQALLGQLSSELSNSVDMHEAAQSLVDLVQANVRVAHTAVITFISENGKLLIKNATQHGYEDPALLQLPQNSFLLQQFRHGPQTLVRDVLCQEIENATTYHPSLQTYQELRTEMDKLKIAVAIPIMVDKTVIGIFIVGDKLSGDAFTKEDIGFLTIIANQTANAIEKARFWEEDQMKSEFVSIASHELLTPTAAIKGYASMVLEGKIAHIDGQGKEFIEKIYQSSDRLANLVQDLLNVSRIESGRLKTYKKPFSLTESVKRAIDELQVKAKEKNLDLRYVEPMRPTGQTIPLVNADPDHVYRVLINLIGNAIKYTPSGWIRCFVEPYNHHFLTFVIQDSGLGIPRDMVGHMFQKFYRADRKSIAGIQGTGLGLYVCKKIVDLMGGEMWLESQEGKGTTFYFTLPIATTPPGTPGATPSLTPQLVTKVVDRLQPTVKSETVTPGTIATTNVVTTPSTMVPPPLPTQETVASPVSKK